METGMETENVNNSAVWMNLFVLLIVPPNDPVVIQTVQRLQNVLLINAQFLLPLNVHHHVMVRLNPVTTFVELLRMVVFRELADAVKPTMNAW